MPAKLACLVTLAVLLAGCSGNSSLPANPNILFISIDDLRPELGAYGAPMKTPNIDRLASEGLLFESHYVQFAVCIPSRVALLTSLSSERTRQVYGPIRWQQVPGAKVMGATFSEAGYETVRLGKIWHVPAGSESGDTWDVAWAPSASPFQTEGAMDLLKAIRPIRDPEERARAPKAPIAEAFDVPDNAYADGMVGDRAVEELRRLSQSDQPFLLAVGFYKPHLPFCAPKKYWDNYQRDEIDIAPNPELPKDMPPIAFNRHPNMFNYDYAEHEPLVMGQRMNDDTARYVRHAYRACVSYSDAQVGRVLSTLDQLGLRENTIVVLWGDHGWHLGDSGMWSKHSNFEAAAHSPLIVSAPGQKARGVSTAALVETVDIFPTLLDLAGLDPLPVTDGQSFAPLLDEPDQPWEDAAFHVFNRSRTVDGERQVVIGHAMRTKRHRYVAWQSGWDADGELVAEELYDYETDPHETQNYASDPEYGATKAELRGRLLEKLAQY